MSKKWLTAAGTRAVRTFAQTLIATISINAAATLQEIDWPRALSIAAVAAILSILTSLTGLPEVDLDEDKED